MQVQNSKLTIFYDGACPMCSLEMKHLKKHDSNHNIVLVDIHDEQFIQIYPYINKDKALQILHAEYNNMILTGLAVTHRAWTLVGKGFWVAPLNWPVFKQIAHLCYLLIARYRHPISTLLARLFKIKHSQCSTGTCYGKPTHHHHRSK